MTLNTKMPASRAPPCATHGRDGLAGVGLLAWPLTSLAHTKGGEPPNRLIGPREFALLLVSIGLVSLLLATLEYRRNMRILSVQYPGTPRSLAVVVAMLLAVPGILALLAVIFRQ